MDIIYSIWLSSIVIYSFGLILHSLGVYIIVYSNAWTCMAIILLNLSIVDILTTLYNIVNYVYKHTSVKKFDSNEEMYQLVIKRYLYFAGDVTKAICFSIELQQVLILLIMSIDRIAFASNSLVYTNHCKTSMTRKVLAVCWLCSITMGYLYAILPFTRSILNQLTLIFGSLFVFIELIRHVALLLKMRSVQAQHPRDRQNIEQLVNKWEEYSVPTLLSLSFMLFFFIPRSMQRFVVKKSLTLTHDLVVLHERLAVFSATYYAIAAFVYIFLTERYRRTASQMFCCASQHRNDVFLSATPRTPHLETEL